MPRSIEALLKHLARGRRRRQYARLTGNGNRSLVGSGIIDYFFTGPSTAFARFLREHGNEKIEHIIVIMREPVASTIHKLVDVITGQNLSSKLQKYGYDDIYHLSIIINRKWKLEKNHIITATKANLSAPGSRLNMRVNNPNLTIGELIKNGEQRAGSQSYWRYSANQNNCQRFVLDTLEGSGIRVSPEARSFIFQDPLNLLEGVSKARLFWLNSLTDLAHLASRYTAIGRLISQFV